MKKEELDRAAWKRNQPENLDFLDLRLYWALRSLYFLFEQGELSREAAAEAKAELMASYDSARAAFNAWQKNLEEMTS